MVTVAERVKGPASYNLPPRFVREIGRIVVSWAYFENCIQEMNWQALGISPAAGRTAMREPRASERLEMLNALIELRDGTWDILLYKSILARTKVLEAKRNLVAHGIWGYVAYANEWHVQLARGTWPKNQSELIKGSKKTNPESVLMSVEKFREATSAIEMLLADLSKLRTSATGPTPFPQKSPEQTAPGNPTFDPAG
jgi:hypothetical protein